MSVGQFGEGVLGGQDVDLGRGGEFGRAFGGGGMFGVGRRLFLGDLIAEIIDSAINTFGLFGVDCAHTELDLRPDAPLALLRPQFDHLPALPAHRHLPASDLHPVPAVSYACQLETTLNKQ